MELIWEDDPNWQANEFSQMVYVEVGMIHFRSMTSMGSEPFSTTRPSIPEGCLDHTARPGPGLTTLEKIGNPQTCHHSHS